MSANGRRPEEIEAEIARTRSDLSETLEALENKLAPRQLLEKGLDMVRHSMDGHSTGRIGETLREHPVPLAMIGIGLGWLMLSGTGASRSTEQYRRRLGSVMGEAAHSVGERVRGMMGRGGEQHEKSHEKSHEESYAHAWTKSEDAARRSTADLGTAATYGAGTSAEREASRGRMSQTAGQTSGAVSSAMSSATRYASDAAGNVGEYGREAWHSAGDYAGHAGRHIGTARDRFGQMMEEYPLAVGALGFLAGAVLAAALPSTRMEDEYMGEARDDLWRQAEEAGREVAGKAQDVASTAASAAADAARDAMNETEEAAKKEAQRQGAGGASASDQHSRGPGDKI